MSSKTVKTIVLDFHFFPKFPNFKTRIHEMHKSNFYLSLSFYFISTESCCHNRYRHFWAVFLRQRCLPLLDGAQNGAR